MDPRLTRLMIYLLALPILYIAICTYLYFQQDSMVFHPMHEAEATLDELAISKGFGPWTNASGQRIGWQSLKGDPANCWLVVHGNGGYALGRNHYRNYAKSSGDPKIYLLEYPGYGARSGTPTEPSLTTAAIDAIDTLAHDPSRRVWLLGESLGSGVASAAVAQRPDKIAGLLLVTPYNTLPAAASSHYPWLPVSLLLRTRFDSETNLRH